MAIPNGHIEEVFNVVGSSLFRVVVQFVNLSRLSAPTPQ